MKKKIIIIGSTGSIGKNTIDIIKKDQKNFEIKLLSTNKNISELIKQAKKFKVKDVIINDYKKFIYAKKKYQKLKINFHNSFSIIDNLLKKKKIFYSMISVVGIDGLIPTLKLIKYSRNIAIVNKESIICGWSLIKKKLKKFKTNFIPIDSEHYSIYKLLEIDNTKNVEKVFITASGGPFLNYSNKKLSNVTVDQALKHPNWKMGQKISIDSATMMNKIFEVIEAKHIFDLDYKNILILTHPKSYIHAIVKFKNGFSKLLIHNPNMKIPIHNSIYNDKNKEFKTNDLNFDILNNLELKIIDKKKFPLINILRKLPKKNSLYETALISINDYFVSKFLNKKIGFVELINLIKKYSNHRDFTKFKSKQVKNVNEIYKISNYVRLKLDTLGI